MEEFTLPSVNREIPKTLFLLKIELFIQDTSNFEEYATKFEFTLPSVSREILKTLFLLKIELLIMQDTLNAFSL